MKSKIITSVRQNGSGHEHQKNNFKVVSKRHQIKLIVGMLLLVFTTLSCSDLDDNEPPGKPETIKRGSELFTLLETVTTQGDNPVENTVCIDFIYPFKVFIYDASLLPQGEMILFGDIQFSAFLAQLPADQSISISFPLQTTLPDGTVFSVNNNAQLKVALDSCSREDIVSYCSGLFGSPVGSCVWEVPYIPNGNNAFAGAVFTADATGTITLYHLNTTYTGTWVFLYLNDELHLNINLSGTSTTAQNWNYNFKVTTFTGALFELQAGAITRRLVKDCSDLTVYTIGQTGPSGGVIAYDKGTFTNGWRYIEVAPTDTIIEEWGCVNATITDAQYDQIGTGYQNSVAIANYHNNLTNYFLNPGVCSSLNNGSVSAKTSLNQTIGLKSDWCIPSINELQLVYNNLHNQGLGNFTATNYWSSSEMSMSKAKCIDFSSGQIVNLDKNSGLIKTRLVRFF